MKRRSFIKGLVGGLVISPIGLANCSAVEHKNKSNGTVDAWISDTTTWQQDRKERIYELSDNQVIAGEIASTNVLDTRGMKDRQLLWLHIRVGDSFRNPVKFVVSLRDSSVPRIDVNSEVLLISEALDRKHLESGAWVVNLPFPIDVPKPCKRYIGLWYSCRKSIWRKHKYTKRLVTETHNC